MVATPEAREAAERVSAVGKVARIVEAVAEENRLSRIAERVQLPVSTVHRILRELLTLGWIRSDGSGGYVLGARLLAFAGQARSASSLVRIATPTLRGLRDSTGHTIHLAARHGDTLVYLAKLEGNSAYQMRSHVGLIVSMHSTAIGKAYLAAMAETELHDLVDRTGLPRRTPRTIVDVEHLIKECAQIRRRGYAIDGEENEEHVRCVAALIVDSTGSPVAGISVSSLSFELDAARLRRHGELVVEAAAQVSALLGSDGFGDSP